MTSRADIQDGIRRFLAARCNVPLNTINASTRFDEDLGLDSFDVVELLIVVDNDYGVAITDAEAVRLETVADAADFIATRRP